MDTAAPARRLLDGRWELGEVLGRGAAADVLAAVDTTTGQPVAVKLLRADDTEAAQRFDREIAALEGVDHPGIVAVLGHGSCADGRPYVVLERADGGSLHEALVGGALPPEAAAALGARLATALAHAHDRGVVHRDVKPANVLIDADGQPKLADFGIARLAGASTFTATGFTMGTPAYLAPEQVRGDAVGPAADIYALGLVVLEAATGERAFGGDGVAAALARLDTAVPVPASVPGALAAAVSAMTSADPGRRPSAREAASMLEAASGAGATSVIPVAATATAAIPAAAPHRTPDDERAAVATGPGPRSALPVRRVAAAAACFLAGFIAVAALFLLLDGENRPAPAPSVTTTTTPAVTSTVPPTTAVEEGDEDEGEGDRPGNGNGRGNGGGNGREDD